MTPTAKWPDTRTIYTIIILILISAALVFVLWSREQNNLHAYEAKVFKAAPTYGDMKSHTVIGKDKVYSFKVPQDCAVIYSSNLNVGTIELINLWLKRDDQYGSVAVYNQDLSLLQPKYQGPVDGVLQSTETVNINGVRAVHKVYKVTKYTFWNQKYYEEDQDYVFEHKSTLLTISYEYSAKPKEQFNGIVKSVRFLD